MSGSLLQSAGMLQFLAGYWVILMIPGPITLTAGSLASMHGFARAVPLLAGIGLGIALLAAVLALGAAQLSGETTLWTVRVAGAVLLGLVAAQIVLRAPRAATAVPAPAGNAGALFAGGVLVGLLALAKASFFTMAFAGVMLPIREPAEAFWVAGITAGFGTLWYGLVALAFSHPRARALTARRHRLVRGVAAACLVVLAARSGLSAFTAAG